MYSRVVCMLYWGALVMSCPVMSQTVLYMEPPNCTYTHVLDEHEVLYLDSSRPSQTLNQDGNCSAHIISRNHTKHLNFYFELGPNITDCAAELLFTDREAFDEKFVLPRYTCNALHPYRQAHADNWTGHVLVTRKYTTMRKDFFFKIKVVQVEPWSDHEDNGLGFYVDRSIAEPSVSFVLYIILGLDFLLPTVIFIVNEFSGRITEDGTRREDPHNKQPHPLSVMNPAFPTTLDASPVQRRHKNAAVGAERQAAFESPDHVQATASAAEDFEGLFPFYKQPSETNNSTTHLKKRVSKTTYKSTRSMTSNAGYFSTDSGRSITTANDTTDSEKKVNFAEQPITHPSGPRSSGRNKSNQQLRFSE